MSLASDDRHSPDACAAWRETRPTDAVLRLRVRDVRREGPLLPAMDGGPSVNASDDGVATLLLADGPLKLARNHGGPASLWVATRGCLRVFIDGDWLDLPASEPFFSCDGEPMTVGALSESQARAVGLVLPRALRERLLPEARAAGLLGAVSQRLSGAHDLGAALARFALRHGVAQPSATGMDGALRELVQLLLREALRCDALVERCPGRTRARRLASYAALLRVHRHIASGVGVGMPLRRVAEMAGMSHWHFLRVFRDVFGETPHAMATRCRLDLARRLVEGTAMPLAAIGDRIGIRSPSTFSQYLRQHFGMTARELRAARLPASHHRAAKPSTAASPAG